MSELSTSTKKRNFEEYQATAEAPDNQSPPSKISNNNSTSMAFQASGANAITRRKCPFLDTVNGMMKTQIGL